MTPVPATPLRPAIPGLAPAGVGAVTPATPVPGLPKPEVPAVSVGGGETGFFNCRWPVSSADEHATAKTTPRSTPAMIAVRTLDSVSVTCQEPAA